MLKNSLLFVYNSVVFVYQWVNYIVCKKYNKYIKLYFNWVKDNVLKYISYY